MSTRRNVATGHTKIRAVRQLARNPLHHRPARRRTARRETGFLDPRTPPDGRAHLLFAGDPEMVTVIGKKI